MKEVTSQKFDTLLAKKITLNRCSCGFGGGRISIEIPYYGKTGVYVECPECKRKTKLYGISTFMTDENHRIATPIIDKSLMFGIKQAISDWNKNNILKGN